ncbi:GNAT family N-acetyltransferase [Cyanobacterium sp. uoEpiScrs1]|uniref:GNAT family N-acetyltransferase n=1 Tax=Cyanobacterium sp. uoEpiScrs1 TaxID=2976343 RepID=UPI00226ACF9F|nr:GNAT family N-acetyltransferase [Cyanobacterium sp. uoEpiScrs1]
MVKETTSPYSIVWSKQIAEIPKHVWDELAKTLKTPFLEWEWLNNIEVSRSVIAGTGWQPNHLTIWKDEQLIGAAPLYIKSHSYGEFVFDHKWADLSYRLGISYYPKLLGMTPFTPVVGYRFLITPKENEVEITQLMITAIDHFCNRNRLSGCHFLFVDPDWQHLMENNGFSSWLHHNYIWSNKEFNSFDDYLAVFNANQRRNIKRERKAITKAGLNVRVFVGKNIPHDLFPLIYKFYSSTCGKFSWGSQYLTSKFFEQLYPHYSHRIVLIAAYTKDNNKSPVGMSFCIRKGEKLYGRYWGCLEEYNYLHFEACYYKPIQWAIQQGISTFDPGAGGLHKQRRGFIATPNNSLHRFYNQKMNGIFRHYIGEVNEIEKEEICSTNLNLPFSKH